MVLETILAAIPLVIVAYLLIGRLWQAAAAAPVGWGIAAIIAFLFWEMPINWLIAATLEGMITAIELLWIIFGALLLLYTMMRAGAIDAINHGFALVSDDRRVQIVMLAFLFATFIEGVAGFGTPAAVIAPLLLGLGFPALAAVIATLIGHIIAVTFGAVGLPVHLGIYLPLSGGGYQSTIEEAGMSVIEFATNAGMWAATYHALVGVMMPFIAVAVVTYYFGEKKSLKPALEVFPLCLFAGFSFIIPYWVSAVFLTSEFPAIISGMVGGLVVVGVLRAGYLHPDSTWDFPPREEWPDHWVGTIEPGTRAEITESGSDVPLWKAWAPYGILVLLLVITRVVDPITEFLQTTLVIEGANILSTTIDIEFEWLFVPGMWLLTTAMIAIPMYNLGTSDVRNAFTETVSRLVSPFIAIVFIVAMVQIMIHSGTPTETESIIVVLALATAGVAGPAYPFIAPLIGAIGAFVAGSNTVSNITFSGFQFSAAEELDLPKQIIVGGQAVGGAIGNLIAIHNVVAALATVGLVGEEGRIMRINLIPLIYYAFFTGLLVALFAYILFPDAF